jgi:transcription initiation factor TFIID TATA-box-binding protein
MKTGENYNVELVNVVGGGDLSVDINLVQLYQEIYVEDIEYEPETHPGVIFELPKSSVTVMIFSSGKYHFTGGDSISTLKKAKTELHHLLKKTGYDIDLTDKDIEIRNLVFKGELGKELDLPQLSVALGYENIEYDPSSFPGLVYRPENGTIIIFMSGKFMMMGTKETDTAKNTIDNFISRIQSLFEKQ